MFLCIVTLVAFSRCARSGSSSRYGLFLFLWAESACVIHTGLRIVDVLLHYLHGRGQVRISILCALFSCLSTHVTAPPFVVLRFYSCFCVSMEMVLKIVVCFMLLCRLSKLNSRIAYAI